MRGKGATAKVIGVDLSTGTDFGARVWGYIDRDGNICITKTELLPPKIARRSSRARGRKSK